MGNSDCRSSSVSNSSLNSSETLFSQHAFQVIHKMRRSILRRVHVRCSCQTSMSLDKATDGRNHIAIDKLSRCVCLLFRLKALMIAFVYGHLVFANGGVQNNLQQRFELIQISDFDGGGVGAVELFIFRPAFVLTS